MKEEKKHVHKWSGERCSYELLRPYLAAMLKALRKGKLHYALTLPDFPRCAESNFTMRICHFDVIPGNVTLQGAFDGVVQDRVFSENDIFVGGYNSSNRVVDMEHSDYGGFSLIFHLQHIRLHYIRMTPGMVVLKNIYFHSASHAEGALAQMLNALDVIIHDRSGRDERCRPLLEAVITQVMHDLDRELSEKAHCYEPGALRIKDYLDSNFQRDINCSMVCDILGINRCWGSTRFRKNFGISMSDYLQNLRLNAAKHLLESKNKLTIREISQLCAFNDAGYFIRVFRKMTGVTPGEFRKAGK